MGIRTAVLLGIALVLCGDDVAMGGLERGLGTLCSTALLLLGGWALLAALVAVLLRVPGCVAAAASALLHVLLPRGARLALAGLVGVQLATGAALASGPAADVALPSVGRPVTSIAAHPVSRPATVVVEPGDSLWSIAADHLGTRADPTRVARAWPRWYAANREAVGPDPDVLAVGVVLVVPGGGRS